jgi:hypothetical protein
LDSVIPFFSDFFAHDTDALEYNGTCFQEEEMHCIFDLDAPYIAKQDDEKGLKEQDRELLENSTNETPKENMEHQHRNLSHLLA